MSSAPASQVSPAKTAAPVAQLLPLDQVLADPNQPRKAFDEASLKELADSIRAEGLLQPILIKPNGKGYLIVDGERRYRAAKLAGLKEVPVLVRADLKDQDVTAQQLVANLQREDLALADQCDAVTRLVKSLGTAKAAASRLGKSDAWVSKRAGIAELPGVVKELIKTGKLVDVELAVGLGEFHEIAKGSKDKCWSLENCMRQARDGHLTRERLRDNIRQEKDSQKWQKEQAEREAREKARAEAAAKSGKGVGKADESKERDRYAEAQRRSGRIMSDRKGLREAATDAIYEGMKLGKKGKFDAPLRFEYVESGSDYNGFPKSAEACHFIAHADGDIATLKRIAAGLAGTVKVRMAGIEGLTLDEAQRISDALKGQASAKNLFLSFEHEITGEQLRTAVKKLAPNQATQLPLTREAKEAAKKAFGKKKGSK